MVKCSVRLKLEWNCSMKWMILLLRNAIHRKSPQHTDRRGNASLEENHSEALDVGCRHKVERQGNSPPEKNTTPSDNTKMRSPSLTEAAGVVVVVGSEKIVRRNGKGASACGEETRTVRGLHRFDFLLDVNAMIMNTVEELRWSLSAYRHYRRAYKEYRWLLNLRPNMFSLLNYIRMHLPEISHISIAVTMKSKLMISYVTTLSEIREVSLQDSDEVLKTFGDYKIQMKFHLKFAREEAEDFPLY
ncbi:hypothetical protein ZIOFF_042258 [Zingiber officinale]|uniref:Uncharacterized protein n=1 Tax=Zingiber officinale TaxID=94328 RepID=A0A8J5GAE9_ZINOF|nr:hypothetical protein ZIOFF_042258 [Zingiber officinale]